MVWTRFQCPDGSMLLCIFICCAADFARIAAPRDPGSIYKLVKRQSMRTKPAIGLSNTFGELFCGAGGLSLGLMQAGFIPVWAIDSDKDACETYRCNIGVHAIRAAVETVDFKKLEPSGGLAFGFPCNDFSMAGGRKGRDGYFGGLYKEAARAVSERCPLWFVAENVPGIMSKGGLEIMRSFADSGPGYTVSVCMFSFERFGVPQKRKRVVGVGLRKDLGLVYMQPVPTSSQPVSASKALEDVEDVESNNEMPAHGERVRNIVALIPPGGCCWHESVPLDLQPNRRSRRMSSAYRRIHPDKPALTLLASGGGGSHLYHWKEPRALTNRENARIQTFPDTFEFAGSRTSVRRQIGMAVPPLGGRAIGESLMKTLAGQPYKCSEPTIAVIRGS